MFYGLLLHGQEELLIIKADLTYNFPAQPHPEPRIIFPDVMLSVTISPTAVATPKIATSVTDFGGLYTILPAIRTARTIRPLRFLIGQGFIYTTQRKVADL